MQTDKRTTATAAVARAATRIAIVGGGFCGTMTAVQLLRQATHPLHIHIFEKDPARLSRGTAYSTTHACHVLNVPAGGMSALPDDPEHFLRWALSHQQESGNLPQVTEISASTFLPRQWYGEYLSELMRETAEEMASVHRLDVVYEEVVDIQELCTGGAELLTSASQRIEADRVVLALGNFPPADPAGSDSDLTPERRYHANPWTPDVLPAILDSRSCLLVGAGLTMLDVLIALREQNYAGTVHVISRRGLMPQSHLQKPAAVDISPILQAANLRDLVRRVRNEVNCGMAKGRDWRSVIDAIRPHNTRLWQSLSLKDQRRFVRHVRPYWENRRHRTAPEIHALFNELVTSGAVVLHKGRIGHVHHLSEGGLSVELQQSIGNTLLDTEQVVNCTGAECNFRKLRSPLVTQMLERGLARSNRIGFGLDTSANGAVINNRGVPSDRIFTLGPPMKGTLWETTAVPELRMQALNVARTIQQND